MIQSATRFEFFRNMILYVSADTAVCQALFFLDGSSLISASITRMTAILGSLHVVREPFPVPVNCRRTLSPSMGEPAGHATDLKSTPGRSRRRRSLYIYFVSLRRREPDKWRI